MAGPKADTYIRAQQALRAHPEWTDQEVADSLGIRLMAFGPTIAEARRELETDGTLPPGSGHPAGTDPDHPLGRRHPPQPSTQSPPEADHNQAWAQPPQPGHTAPDQPPPEEDTPNPPR